jgi:hypothetical protein
MTMTTRAAAVTPYVVLSTAKKSMAVMICAVTSMVWRLPGMDSPRYVEIKHNHIYQLAFLGQMTNGKRIYLQVTLTPPSSPLIPSTTVLPPSSNQTPSPPSDSCSVAFVVSAI